MSIIGICSAKGGVGKTTITTNLGISLTKNFNKKVLLIDSNFTTASCSLHFGITSPSLTLIDVFKKRVPIAKAVYRYDSNLDIIPAPLNIDLDNINLKGMKSCLKNLKNYDFILVDAAPGTDNGALTAIESSDEILIVTTPDLPSVIGATKIISMAKKLNKKVRGLVINRVQNKNYEVSMQEIESVIGSEIICCNLPEEKEILKSITTQQPIILKKPLCRFSYNINKLASKITGIEYKPPNFFERLINLIQFRKKEVSEKELITKSDIAGLKEGLTRKIKAKLKKEKTTYSEKELANFKKEKDNTISELNKLDRAHRLGFIEKGYQRTRRNILKKIGNLNKKIGEA